MVALPLGVQGLLLANDELLELGEVLPLQVGQALLVVRQVVLDLVQRLVTARQCVELRLLSLAGVGLRTGSGGPRCVRGSLGGVLGQLVGEHAHLELREATSASSKSVRSRGLVRGQVAQGPSRPGGRERCRGPTGRCLSCLELHAVSMGPLTMLRLEAIHRRTRQVMHQVLACYGLAWIKLCL